MKRINYQTGNFQKMQNCDVLIIGAGAAGMMCGIEAGKRKRKVLLLDHSKKLGRKILISGGGRCNFTNINTSPQNFVSNNPHFCKSALARYTPETFLDLVQSHRINFHEKRLGQLFCDKSAQEIVDMLHKECLRFQNKFVMDCHIQQVEKQEHFLVTTNQGTFTSDSLVIATGGLSVPLIGATGFGYDLARQFGLNIIKPTPALDGFVFSTEQRQEWGILAGVSLDTIVSCNGASFRENVLFTHTGLSGPASLQASLYWEKSKPLSIDLFPEYDIASWLIEQRKKQPGSLLKNVIAELLPKRFSEELAKIIPWHGNISSLAERTLEEAGEMLHTWQIQPESTVGFKKAEVTKGGVDTSELSSKTMESKKVPSLYFIGEVVDVTGQLGGYNFQWAWSSGYVAGQNV